MISLRGFRSAQLLSGQSLCQQRYRSEQHLNEQILITFRQALQSPRHLLTSSNGKKSESERMNESVLSSNESLVMSDFNNLQPHLLPDNLSIAFDVCVHVVNKWSEWIECMGSDVSTRWFGLLQADPCWEPPLLCCIPVKLRYYYFILDSDAQMTKKQMPVQCYLCKFDCS